jgi:hypothetical protein
MLSDIAFVGCIVAFSISGLSQSPERREPGLQKRNDQPTDITATKNMVTNAASKSTNMAVIPSSTLGPSL